MTSKSLCIVVIYVFISNDMNINKCFCINFKKKRETSSMWLRKRMVLMRGNLLKNTNFGNVNWKICKPGVVIALWKYGWKKECQSYWNLWLSNSCVRWKLKKQQILNLQKRQTYFMNRKRTKWKNNMQK